MRATNLKNLFTVSLLILAIGYLAVPTWAEVDIFATDMGNGEVVISFDARSEPNLVRAFALDIRFDTDANITDVTLLNPDYIIHPGTIQFDSQSNIIDYGTPVAPQSDLPEGTLPGLDSNGVTIELGSLYAPVGPGSPNAPDPYGPLVSVRFNGAGSCCDPGGCLTISANTARAGPTGVVMESPDEVVIVNLPPAPICVQVGPPCCYGPQADCYVWELVGSPACWCYPRQCLGDADGLPYGKSNYYVSIPDLSILKNAWNKTLAEIKEQPPPLFGVPLICADFDHLPYGKFNYRVSIPDLDILKANWNISGGPGPGCLPGNTNP